MDHAPAQRCVFCEIAAGLRSAHLVDQAPNVIAFMDQYRQPFHPAHVLVIPREHIEDIYAVAPLGVTNGGWRIRAMGTAAPGPL